MSIMITKVFESCMQQLKTVEIEEEANLRKAAEAVAKSIIEHDVYYTFGSGHSNFIARDAYWRAGGLAPAMPITDPMGGDAERMPGLADIILTHYDLRPGSAIVIISNSGINALPIEIALAAKEKGMTVIAITSRQHSSTVASRYPTGVKLMDLADIIIDTHGVPGDATLTLPGTQMKVAPTSTAIGATIMQSIIAEAAAILLENKVDPPVIVSMNMPDGDKWNRHLEDKYRPILARYEVARMGVEKKG